MSSISTINMEKNIIVSLSIMCSPYSMK